MKFFILIFLTQFLFGQFQFDTLSHKKLVDGASHTKINISSAPWMVNVLRFNFAKSHFSIETIKAQDKLAGYEKTSSMSARRNSANHFVVGGVNGDFYGSGGVPINMQVVNGAPLRMPGPQSLFGVSENKKLQLSPLAFNSVFIAKNLSIKINTINAIRQTDFLVLFNNFFGSSTSTNQWGTEIVTQPITKLFLNDTVKLIVKNKRTGVGNTTIAENEIVFSGHGVAQQFLNSNISIGDTIKIFLGILPAPKQITQLIGGFPQILKNGINFVADAMIVEGNLSHAYERHPRTALGFSSDSTEIIFVTVDGRQSLSVGMNLNELASLMINLGAHHAINFDGGGSTTMVAGNAIVNSPSDAAGERSVANAIFLISSLPITSIFDNGKILNDFHLFQNYPNPFNSTTIISYQLSVSSFVTLKVFDVLGKEIATLVNENKEAGKYFVGFDAEKFSSQKTGGLTSGVYFYRIAIHSDKLTVGDFTEIKKILMIK